VPPTSKSEIPDNYKEIYSNKRRQKNLKIAKVLKVFNFNSLADKIMNDPAIYQEVDFNPVKTWIEYLNRLVGVVVGILIFSLFIYSLKYFKIENSVVVLSFLSLILVGIEGWLGSIVVSTNLLPFTITIHMGLALILVSLLILLKVRIENKSQNKLRKYYPVLYNFLLLASIITFIQILVGTQVREEIDIISASFNFQNRSVWIENLSGIFKFHRSFSIIVLLLNFYIAFLYFKKSNSFLFNKSFLILITILLLEILAGIILSYFSIPSFLQPIHLSLGCGLFGIQSYLLFSHAKTSLNFSIKI
jgi:cytochrome c oxidase assembly protein subunit 15